VRALITYDHCSPAQVAALEGACQKFSSAGHWLLPVEFYGALPAYGWSLRDAERPSSWRCLYPESQSTHRAAIAGKLARVVRQTRADAVVINGWFEPVSWCMTLAKELLGVRLALVADSTEADHPRRPVTEWLKRLFLKRIDAVFTAGTRQRRYLEQLGYPADRMATGCDVVDNDRFAVAAARRKVRSTGEPIVIGTAARLVPAKNLHAALEAVARATADRSLPRFTWRVAGRGPLAAELEARAGALDAPVEFVGFVDYPSLPDFYASLDLYWQPSLSEPWGLTVNEAMASGLPILASDRCGCLDDLVSGDNGFVHGTSVEGLAAGLRAAFHGRAAWEAMGRLSQARIREWGLDRFASGLLTAIQMATTGVSPRSVGDRAPEPGPLL
jgi:glycosyltransferase involved in cell wall biosynthesis